MRRATKCVLVALATLPAAALGGQPMISVWDADAALNAALRGSSAALPAPSRPVAAASSALNERSPAADMAAPFSRLSLSKIQHSMQKKQQPRVLVFPKTDIPKQLSGYLGWSKSKGSSFSTRWKTVKGKAAPADMRSDYMRDLEDGRPQPVVQAPREALVTAGTAASHGTSHAGFQSVDLPNLNALDWDSDAKPALKKPRAALATEGVQTSNVNQYLASVGWKAPTLQVPVQDNPYLAHLSVQGGRKKFLAAAEQTADVAVRKETGGVQNRYLNDIMPGFMP
mmetsp:Transcript_81416/g.141338  ORF Transcript_81416/g.141338 Transcript_81416/m.141338 type:complete len:283 (+) Transcript_81416:62-910(+)